MVAEKEPYILALEVPNAYKILVATSSPARTQLLYCLLFRHDIGILRIKIENIGILDLWSTISTSGPNNLVGIKVLLVD